MESNTKWLYDIFNYSKMGLRKKDDELTKFGKGLALSVAYGANAGGIATLTGTPPNLILQGMANR